MCLFGQDGNACGHKWDLVMREECGLLPSTALPLQKIKLASHIAVTAPACDEYPVAPTQKERSFGRTSLWERGMNVRGGRGRGGIF